MLKRKESGRGGVGFSYLCEVRGGPSRVSAIISPGETLTWRVVAHQCTASQQREMLRRPSSKIDAEIAEPASITTPSTQRASMKVEVGKVAAKVKEASPRKSRKKEVKTEMDVDEKSLDNEKESTLAIKINRVKAKAAPKEAQEPKERPRKRTATADDDLNPEENRANKTTKKTED